MGAAENWNQAFRWSLMYPGSKLVIELGYLLNPDGELELTPILKVATMECDVVLHEKSTPIVSGANIEASIHKLLGGILSEYTS